MGSASRSSKTGIPPLLWDRCPHRSLYSHRLRMSRIAHSALPRKFQKPGLSQASDAGARRDCPWVLDPARLHRLRVSRGLMVRCPWVFASLLGSPGASSALSCLTSKQGHVVAPRTALGTCPPSPYGRASCMHEPAPPRETTEASSPFNSANGMFTNPRPAPAGQAARNGSARA